MRIHLLTIACLLATFAGVRVDTAMAERVNLVKDGKPVAAIYLTQGVDRTPAEQAVIQEVADWLSEEINKVTGAALPTSTDDPKGAAIVLCTMDEALASGTDKAFLKTHLDAFVILTRNNQLLLVGNNPYALRHAAAHLLHTIGFRYYAPSPKWHVHPTQKDLAVEINIKDKPDLTTRSAWYAYGNRIGNLDDNYQRWAMGNSMSLARRTATGHSYGNIINRNKAEFEKHPEYLALNEDGSRDSIKSPNAAKFCVSNKRLIDLVVKDRVKLLEENKQRDPLAYMVSIDPSDGQGTCLCKDCEAIGTTTDRVFSLANHVARGLREKYPDAWAGLYAYSSHRLPPTIDVEPNVYVQVAMGFNRTQYSLPELVSLWSEKVEAIGLREYYGVEAWDWGLPGRMRGGLVEYHRKWIPYYAKRKLNAINAETNANWGGQTLGLYVAAQMMWDVDANVDQLVDNYFVDCFGKGAAPMRSLQEQFDRGSPLHPATLVPMYDDLQKAYDMGTDPNVRARLVDMMAYLIYVEKYRQFSSVEAAESSRNDVYYNALGPLMNYAWHIRMRDIKHYYALARRLCNGRPVSDKRLDYYMFNKEQPPVWQNGDDYTDSEIVKMFAATHENLKNDSDSHITYSRMFDKVTLPGKDAGPCIVNNQDVPATVALRGPTTGYLFSGEARSVTVGMKPNSRSSTLTVFDRRDNVIIEKTATDKEAYLNVTFDLPRAGDYRWELKGHAILRVSEDVPLIYEASLFRPAWVDYSGPSYFYVPKGTKQLRITASPRLSLWAPGVKKRIDVTPATNVEGESYTLVNVPEGADGMTWYTDWQTRGQVMFLNIPPFFSVHKNHLYLPREIAQGDGWTTGE